MGQPLTGIVILNGLFLLAGLGLLAGIRGWSTWLRVVEDLGIAFMLGVCATCVLATLVLIAGGGLSEGAVLGCVGTAAVGGACVAFMRRTPLPRTLGPLPRPTLATLVAAALAVSTAVVLVALFRVARVMPMGGGDSFEFWVPKAKFIYFFGTIDSDRFTSLISPRYPLLVPALQAMDFRFMGSAFAPELSVQYWFLYAGFVLAAASLLRLVVPAWLAWGAVALTAVLPELDARMLNAQADWALDVFYGLAAIALLAWLSLGERWLLPCYALFAAAVIATKQEGLLIVGCLVAGVLVATVRRRRAVWLPVLVSTGVAYGLNLPWRVWWGTRDLPATLPTLGLSQLFDHFGRVWPSLWLILRLLFAYDHWLDFVPLAVAAALVGLTLRGKAREIAAAFLVASTAAVLGFTYILWDDLTYVLDERQSSTPMPRAVGSIVLLSIVVAPLLVKPLLKPTGERVEVASAAQVPLQMNPEPG
jgi:hypothetical protein